MSGPFVEQPHEIRPDQWVADPTDPITYWYPDPPPARPASRFGIDDTSEADRLTAELGALRAAVHNVALSMDRALADPERDRQLIAEGAVRQLRQLIDDGGPDW
jgi:hypothetical protein